MRVSRRTVIRQILHTCALVIALSITDASATTVTAMPPRQDTSHIAYNQIVESHLTDSVTQQEWTFTARAGNAILIDMRAAESALLDTFLTLLDPMGNTVAADDDSGEGLNARIGPVVLAQGGTHTIIASSYNGNGGYTLALTDVHTLPELSAGKPLVGTVSAEHPSEMFRLVSAPDRASPLARLSVSDDNPYADPFIAIYGESGFIAGTEETAASALDPVALIPDQITVAVVAWNPDSPGGAYEVTLEPSAIGLFADGVPQRGSLDYNTFTQQHYFVAQSGDVVRVTIAVEGDIAPAIEVLSADFAVLLFTNSGEHVREVTAEITVPQSGIYVVSVTDGAFRGESGTYTLRLDWRAE